MAQQCIVCNGQSRKLYVEENNSENVFCGKECQSVFYNRHALMTAKLIGGPFTYLMERPDFNAGTVTAMVQRMSFEDIASVMQDLLADTSVDPVKKEKVLYWIANPLFPSSSKLEDYQEDLIFETIKKDNMELSKWLLVHGGYDPSMGTHAFLLRMASIWGRVDLVTLLLRDDRVDPRESDSLALLLASDHGISEIVKLLLEDGRADPRARNSQALVEAVNNGRTKVVKLLLEDGRADPQVVPIGQLLTYAVVGNPDIIRLFINDGRADLSRFYDQGLITAADRNSTKVVELLLQDGRANPLADDSGALRYAAKNGNVKVVKLLLQDGRANPLADDSGALRYAAKYGNVKVVKLLLQDGRADPSANNDNALKSAVETGYHAVAELLLHDERIDPEEYDGPAIRGFGRLVTYLVDRPGFNRKMVTKMLRRMYSRDAVKIMQELITNPLLDLVNKEKTLSWFAHPEWSPKELEPYRPRLLKTAFSAEHPDVWKWLIFHEGYDHSIVTSIVRRLEDAKKIIRIIQRVRLDTSVDTQEKEKILHWIAQPQLPVSDLREYQLKLLREAKAEGHQEVVELLLRDGRAKLVVDEHDGRINPLKEFGNDKYTF